MAARSPFDIGRMACSRSTKRRYPASVGIRPAEVCGAMMSPASSSAAMSLRTVAAETLSRWRSRSALEPTGSDVCT